METTSVESRKTGVDPRNALHYGVVVTAAMQRRGIARTKEDISYFRTLARPFVAYFVEKVYVCT